MASGRGGVKVRRGGSGVSRDLIVAANFIRAVRESGYVSLSTALAELIDNSLQAEARTIAITIRRDSAEACPEIEVVDDGVGMDRGHLEACLQFGGTARFNDRLSFGRFGMGLPAASLSQSRHIRVVAWQHPSNPIGVSLDVDEIAAGSPPCLRAIRSAFEPSTPSGCVVSWHHCDRIEYQRLAWLERGLQRDLGRMYRRFLRGGVGMSINGTAVKPTDPLLIDATVERTSAALAFEPLHYDIRTAGGGSSPVTVRFSVLPVDAWHHLDNLTKRRAGIVGGGGVSILRAGREIALGWHLMGGKRKENYDDWWRCEIEFDPALDEQFGITINKQGIRPSAQLREALEPELEAMARLLNARVRQAFEDVKFRAATDLSCRIAEAAEPHMPVIQRGGRQSESGPLAYRLTSSQSGSDTMLTVALNGLTMNVILNADHPAFAALFGPLQALTEESGNNPLRTAVELLMLSFARATVSTDACGSQLTQLLTAWGDAYARMLQKR